MVVPENERQPMEERDLIGSFFETEDGRLAYFRKGNYRGDGTDLEVLDDLPTDTEAFTELISSKDFILSERLSAMFRQAMDNLEQEVEEADGSGVDSAE